MAQPCTCLSQSGADCRWSVIDAFSQHGAGADMPENAMASGATPVKATAISNSVAS